ncbi:MAG: NAD(P)H-dependent oxidoreductase subunit E [bacterium]|nr:NAD(P)H-dependent oxidoreductase subunit E [bacterium]
MDTEAILKKYEPVNHNLLLILHDIQNNNPQNYLPEDDLDRVIRYLNTTRSAVYGVAEYYSMFSLEPRGKHIIRTCISPVCRLLGCVDVMNHLKENLGVKLGETTADGRFTLEHSECLGHCEKAPMLMFDREVHGDLTSGKIEALIETKKKEASKETGGGS